MLVFEDIHWAEEPLLELIEHLVDLGARGAAARDLCLARPELLDIRPGWGGGRVRATSIELEPLGASESEQLIDALRTDTLDPAERAGECSPRPRATRSSSRRRCGCWPRKAASGIEPHSGHAAGADRRAHRPAARRRRRRVLQRAAVIGRIFWEGAIERLSPELESLEEALDDLLLREFVLDEERSSIRGEKAYKFKHVLIREVAYSGSPSRRGPSTTRASPGG